MGVVCAWCGSVWWGWGEVGVGGVGWGGNGVVLCGVAWHGAVWRGMVGCGEVWCGARSFAWIAHQFVCKSDTDDSPDEAMAGRDGEAEHGA